MEIIIKVTNYQEKVIPKKSEEPIEIMEVENQVESDEVENKPEEPIEKMEVENKESQSENNENKCCKSTQTFFSWVIKRSYSFDSLDKVILHTTIHCASTQCI